MILYLWAKDTSTYLVVIPKNAVIHIQKSAAGPPMKIAIATPPMFPVPTVPDKAVLKAWKGVVSPLLSLYLFPEKRIFQALLKKMICGNLR